MLHDLCIGKTGTLTEGKMSVHNYHIGQAKEPVRHQPILEGDQIIRGNNTTLQEMAAETVDALYDCLFGNNEARFEPEDECYEPRGTAIGVAVLNFLTENNVDCYAQMIQRAAK